MQEVKKISIERAISEDYQAYLAMGSLSKHHSSEELYGTANKKETGKLEAPESPH